MSDEAPKIEIKRGLKEVYFDRSRRLLHRWPRWRAALSRYSIHDLAQHSTFEEACHLLLKGELPTRDQLRAFDEELKAARTLPAPVYEVIRAVRSAHPMDVLRTAVSALAAFDPDVAANSPEATLRKGIRLTSQVPMIVARARSDSQRPRADRTGSRAVARGELPLHAERQGPSADAAS
jgi:citrate synthase